MLKIFHAGMLAALVYCSVLAADIHIHNDSTRDSWLYFTEGNLDWAVHSMMIEPGAQHIVSPEGVKWIVLMNITTRERRHFDVFPGLVIRLENQNCCQRVGHWLRNKITSF